MQDWKTLRQVIWFQRRPLIWGAGTLILSVFVFALGAWPQWQARAVLQKQEQKVHTELDQLRKRAQLVQDVSPERKQQYAVAERAAPAQKLPLTLLRSLEAMANDSQLLLGKYDLSPGVISTDSAALAISQKAKGGKKTGAGTQESLPLQMEVVGTFSQVTKFVGSVENALPLFSIQELAIEPAKKGGEFLNGERRYTVLISLESYYFPLDIKKLSQQVPQPLSPSQQTAETRIKSAKFWLDGAALSLPKNFQNTNIFGVLDLNNVIATSAAQVTEATEASSSATTEQSAP